MQILRLGLAPYQNALAQQEAHRNEVAAGAEERVLLLEHPPVITMGRKATPASMLCSKELLAARGVDVAHISRGGDVTCHFPGQLVAYVHLRMETRPGGLHGLVHDLEESVIALLDHYGVAALRMPGRPGVWVGPRKIASIGLALKRWVTWHGLALNIGPDLSLFDLVVPCGLQGVEMTSLSRELGRDVTINEVLDVYETILQRTLAPAPMA